MRIVSWLPDWLCLNSPQRWIIIVHSCLSHGQNKEYFYDSGMISVKGRTFYNQYNFHFTHWKLCLWRPNRWWTVNPKSALVCGLSLPRKGFLLIPHHWGQAEVQHRSYLTPIPLTSLTLCYGHWHVDCCPLTLRWHSWRGAEWTEPGLF